MTLIRLLIILWPDIYRLLKSVEKEGLTDEQARGKINEAFKTRDSERLNKLFNSDGMSDGE